MLRFVLGAKRLWNDRWDATTWLALAEKVSVICVPSLGSLTTKTTLSATSTRRSLMNKLTGRRISWKG